MSEVKHIGMAGRKSPRFRFREDRQEVSLEVSAELAGELLAFLDAVDTGRLSPPLVELRDVLIDLDVQHGV